ncbi:hypothetical protein BDY19DRAFT_959467 [Irpex rosettiformis]|uniref:Uncharacterized protein n=1 Tax=Irpex rosettiformis TaxID=378272 RepID=A0ACB8TXB5_9APHY|nr:hypothetical protein BDY19DRAFT_959467 [Irpex rosettiformis]
MSPNSTSARNTNSAPTFETEDPVAGMQRTLRTPPPQPPRLPINYTYTSQYCEENVYLLADCFHQTQSTTTTREWPWTVYVVFISNDDKTATCSSTLNFFNVALWNQRSSKRPEMGNLVVWDYHVVLVLVLRKDCNLTRKANEESEEESGSNDSESLVGELEESTIAWVYDFDSCSEMPCSFKEYIRGTFPYAPVLDGDSGWEVPERYAR